MRIEAALVVLRLRKAAKWTLSLLGLSFLIVFILAFSTQPFWMYFRLGTATADYRFVPQNIIVLGGAGMPSEANLMRCYTAAELAERFPKSAVIIALANDSSQNILQSAAWKMRTELVLRGVDAARIGFELNGRSTHEQAVNLLQRLPSTEATVIVTSPEHMYRSLLTFRKAGLRFVGGQPAFEKSLDADLRTRRKGPKDLPPGMTDELQYRYQFWNHLKYQVVCYREYAALLYYKMKGWI